MATRAAHYPELPLLESLAEPVLLWDHDWRIVWCSAQACALLEQPVTALVGLDAAALPWTDPVTGQRLLRQLHAGAMSSTGEVFLPGGNILRLHMRHCRLGNSANPAAAVFSLLQQAPVVAAPDNTGYRTLFESSSTLFCVPDPEDLRILAVSEYVQKFGIPANGDLDTSDINMLVQAQALQQQNEQLKMSEQHLQAIFRDAALGIAATDIHGFFTDANEAYCRMLGYSREELLTLNVHDLTCHDDLSQTLSLRAELINGTRTGCVFEKRYITRSGNLIWCRVSVSRVRDDNGQISNLVAIAEDITPKKHTETELHNSRMLERIGSRIARVGGWMVEYGGSPRVYWAQEVYEIFECSASEPPALEHMLALYTPTCSKQLQQALEACRTEGRAFDLELQATTFKGLKKWLRIAGEADLDSNGKPCRAFGALQDISRQKDQQLRSQLVSSQLFATLESMSDAFYMIDSQWHMIYMNSEAERLLKRSRKELMGHCILDSFPTLSNSILESGFHAAMHSGEAWYGEYYSEYLADWISVSAFPSPNSLAVYFRSVTAEKSLREELESSAKRLKHVTAAALDIAWEFNLEARSIWITEGLQKRFGFDREGELIPLQGWLDMVHDDDRENLRTRLAALNHNTDTTWAVRYRFNTPAGTCAHFDDRGYVLRDGSGQPVRLVGGSTDITRRLEMEDKLVQSQQLESIGKLTGGIAHDFNNLLTVILGNNQLLREQLQENSNLWNLSTLINLAALRGAKLTSHLLAFSRKQALQPKAVDVNELLGSLKSVLSHTLSENISIRTRLQRDLWQVMIDPHQLEIALMNLSVNARDAMQQGGTLTFETRNLQLGQTLSLSHSEVPAGDYVVLRVSDNGTGIPGSILDHVFEPFFTTKEIDKGTGLGLSMVFGFIKQSNGHLDLYSEQGSGTVFSLYLPRTADLAASVTSENSETGTGSGSELILLVEDNELVRRLGHTLLQSLGYQVLQAANATAALEILRARNDISLLFTDVMMPGMSGPELATMALELQPDIRVLFASGYNQDFVDDNHNAGFSLLEKPYNKAGLAAKIRAVLDSSS